MNDKDIVEAVAKDVGMSFGAAFSILLLALAIGVFFYLFEQEEKPMPADDDITMDGKNYYPYERVLYCLQNRWECRK